MVTQEVHISSLIVYAKPDRLETVSLQISKLDEAEIYGKNPDGKIVVVVETDHQHFVSEVIDKINNLDGVVSTSLIFHQIDFQDSLNRDCL